MFQNTDLAHRVYDAMVFQSRYSINPRWSVNGQFTLELRNDGNYEGEGINTPGATTRIGDYPEIFPAAQFLSRRPPGEFRARTPARVAHLQLWPRLAPAICRCQASGATTPVRCTAWQGDDVPLTGAQAGDPQRGGLSGPAGARQTVFFTGARGDRTSPATGCSTSINYDIPVFRSLKPWVKFDVFNLFNNEKLIAWSTTYLQVRTRRSTRSASTAARRSERGPATPCQSEQRNINAFPLLVCRRQAGGRTFLVASGFRF